MHPRSFAGSLVFGLTLAAAPLFAQASDRYSTYDHPEPHRDPVGYATPPGRRVMVEPVASRVITVERMRSRIGSQEMWVRRGYRPVTLWVVDGRYYDRYDPYWERGVRRADVRQVVVYERDGRYWRDYDYDGDGDHDNRDRWIAQHDRWHHDHAYDRDFERKHREWHREHRRDNRDRDRDGDRD